MEHENDKKYCNGQEWPVHLYHLNPRETCINEGVFPQTVLKIRERYLVV